MLSALIHIGSTILVANQLLNTLKDVNELHAKGLNLERKVLSYELKQKLVDDEIRSEKVSKLVLDADTLLIDTSRLTSWFHENNYQNFHFQINEQKGINEMLIYPSRSYLERLTKHRRDTLNRGQFFFAVRDSFFTHDWLCILSS